MFNLLCITKGEKEQVHFDEINDVDSASLQNGRFSFNIIPCNVKLTTYMLLIATMLLAILSGTGQGFPYCGEWAPTPPTLAKSLLIPPSPGKIPPSPGRIPSSKGLFPH